MKEHDENLVTYLAVTDARNKKVPFGIKAKDRIRHVYVIGKTGMGKSTLLENMAVQDIQNGEGFAFIDPHGSTAEKILEYIGEERMKDVLYFAPFDMNYPVSFNVMEDVGADKRHLVANGLMSAFKKIWVDAWSARMEYILNNIILALLEYPDSTLIGVNRMLADKSYRKKVVLNITDPSVKSFWVDEFEKYGERYMQEAGAAIQNKIGQFISNPLIRNIIGQPKSSFDVRHMMDEKKIIIINLSKGKVGEANANLLGSMLITKIYLAAMSRADVRHDEMKRLPNFYLYVDEFQSFANESFANILSEARKYKLNLTIAHQYIEQMSEEVRAAVFGNVGTMIVFRVGAYDAEIFEKEFSPEFTAEDMVNLGFAQVYMKLMIDGVSSSPFSAITLPPIAQPRFTYVDQLIELSRNTYASPRPQVEDFIRKWHESDLDESKDGKKKFSNTGSAPSGNSSFNREKEFKATAPDATKPPQKAPIGALPKVTQPFKSAFKYVFDRSSGEKRDTAKSETALREAISHAYSKESKDLDLAQASQTQNKEKFVMPAVMPSENVFHKDTNLPKAENPSSAKQKISPLSDEERKKTINYKKEMTPENLEILKKAISSISSESSKSESQNMQNISSNRTKEIPKDELKRMLEVDDDENPSSK